MKGLTKILMAGVLAVMTVAACQNSDDDPDDVNGEIQGTYTGLISRVESNGVTSDSFEGTTTITLMGDREIELHCYGADLDTTLVLNYYEHLDSVNVCLTGEAFETMYGHMLGSGHMGGMMGDIRNGETEWEHHMSDEHQEGDEHFGGFDRTDHSFRFDFRMMNEGNAYTLRFQGQKE
jgi:hypothetical protein